MIYFSSYGRPAGNKHGHHLLCIFIAISLVSNESLFSSSSSDIAFVYIS